MTKSTFLIRKTQSQQDTMTFQRRSQTLMQRRFVIFFCHCSKTSLNRFLVLIFNPFFLAWGLGWWRRWWVDCPYHSQPWVHGWMEAQGLSISLSTSTYNFFRPLKVVIFFCSKSRTPTTRASGRLQRLTTLVSILYCGLIIYAIDLFLKFKSSFIIKPCANLIHLVIHIFCSS